MCWAWNTLHTGKTCSASSVSCRFSRLLLLTWHSRSQSTTLFFYSLLFLFFYAFLFTPISYHSWLCAVHWLCCLMPPPPPPSLFIIHQYTVSQLLNSRLLYHCCTALHVSFCLNSVQPRLGLRCLWLNDWLQPPLTSQIRLIGQFTEIKAKWAGSICTSKSTNYIGLYFILCCHRAFCRQWWRMACNCVFALEWTRQLMFRCITSVKMVKRRKLRWLSILLGFFHMTKYT